MAPSGPLPPEDWRRLEALFDQAAALPAAEREAFTASETEGQPELAAELRALLEAHESSHPLLDPQPPAGLSTSARIGPYVIDRLIGEGGAGKVYLAHRADHQFEKQVAVKLVPQALGMLAERFLHERQILAALEHPNIARLLDAGITAEGQPYLVMEFVDGPTLDAWNYLAPRSMEERLRVWLQVAAAVGHAHRNLVVHRDLKPRNILVDPGGSPKLVDFGIAKLLEQPASAWQTMTGAQLFTPLYASPEQMSGAPVTVSTDIYSLGVILHFLLSGKHPFWIEGQTPVALMKTVLEEEPRLDATLPADLRAVIAKAIEKLPARRYGSVEQFIEDVERYRAGRPVAARPATVSYRFWKFVRRHRWSSTAAAAAIALVTGLTVATWIQARAAQLQRQRAEKTTEFLTNLLGGTPGRVEPDLFSKGQQLRVVEVIDRASQRIETELAGQPDVEASLRESLGMIYFRLGRFNDSGRELERGRSLAVSLYGENDPRTYSKDILRACLKVALGQFTESEAIFRRVQDRWHDMSASMRLVLNANFGVALLRLGKLTEAEQTLQAGIAAMTAAGQVRDPQVALALNNLGLVYLERADETRAAQTFTRCIDLSREFRPPPEALGWCLVNSTAMLLWRGRYAEAKVAAQEARAAMIATMGAGHPALVHSVSQMAVALSAEGDAGAEKYMRDMIELQNRALPPEHYERAVGLLNLGIVLVNLGRPADAVPPLRRALEIRKKVFHDPNWRIAETQGALGEALWRTGNREEARPLLESSIQSFEKLYGAEFVRTVEAKKRLERLQGR